jgi:hypothetical protein
MQPWTYKMEDGSKTLEELPDAQLLWAQTQLLMSLRNSCERLLRFIGELNAPQIVVDNEKRMLLIRCEEAHRVEARIRAVLKGSTIKPVWPVSQEFLLSAHPGI